MARVELWESRFLGVLVRARTAPFEWGKHDCALFACDVVEALTGKDPGAQWRGTYSTKEECDEILETNGGLAALMEGIAYRHGWPEVDRMFAQRGDVVLAKFRGRGFGGRDTLGVCIGKTFAFPMEPKGLFYLPRNHGLIVKAWRIQ